MTIGWIITACVLASLHPLALAVFFLTYAFLLPALLSGEPPSIWLLLLFASMCAVLPLAAYSGAGLLYRWCFEEVNGTLCRAGALLAGVFTLLSILGDYQVLSAIPNFSWNGVAATGDIAGLVGRVCIWSGLSVSLVMLSVLTVELPFAWATSGIGAPTQDRVRILIRWSCTAVVLWGGWYLIAESFSQRIGIGLFW